MSEFKPKISNVEQINGELSFLLSGDDDYGFDKSLVNALRRILLTDIPSIAFNFWPSHLQKIENLKLLYV